MTTFGSHVYRIPAKLNIEITKTLSKSSSRVDNNREASLKANSSTIHPASVVIGLYQLLLCDFAEPYGDSSYVA
jgi:hypothetical protein